MQESSSRGVRVQGVCSWDRSDNTWSFGLQEVRVQVVAGVAVAARRCAIVPQLRRLGFAESAGWLRQEHQGESAGTAHYS